MLTRILLIGVLVFTLGGISWAAEISCDAMPAGSISRMECETNAAKLKSAPGPKAGISNLGQAGSGVESLEPEALCGNPLAYFGHTVVLRGVKMKRAMGLGSATFGGDGSCELIVSGLPTDRGFSSGGWYDITVRPTGTTQATNSYGATIVVPKAVYLGLP